MSEWNTIFDTSNEVIGTFRHGIAWCRKTGNRLGEYDEVGIYNNDRKIVAILKIDSVFSSSGEELGSISDKSIMVQGPVVGHFIGSKYAGAAAIPLLFMAESNAL